MDTELCGLDQQTVNVGEMVACVGGAESRPEAAARLEHC